MVKEQDLSRSAWKEEDLFTHSPPESFALTEKGLISKEEAEMVFDNSPQIFWQVHEGKLWFAIIVLAFLFLVFIVG